ncbi:hypothetical protein PAAL109150_25205 [Paenibacillus alkaliterrae]
MTKFSVYVKLSIKIHSFSHGPGCNARCAGFDDYGQCNEDADGASFLYFRNFQNILAE